jgi:signal transduction histidine kinase
LTWFLAFGERQRTMSQFREGNTLDLAEHLLFSLDGMPVPERLPFLARANRRHVRLAPWQGVDTPPAQASNAFGSALSARLGATFEVRVLADKPRSCSRGRESSLERGQAREAESFLVRWALRFYRPPNPLCERVLIRLPDQSGFVLTVLSPRILTPPPLLNMPSMMLFVFSVALLAYAVARMTMRPLADLALAASNLGRDIHHPPLAIRGATEIRQASTAFNAMQARIGQHISQRTQMLAAITHDLQTPLTRLRLRLEKVQDTELREKLIGDLSAMQLMVREGLDLARSIDSTETMQLLDIDSLLDSVCSDAVDAGQALELHGQVGVCIMARPIALRRCLMNLIDNALKYGKSAKVSIALSANAVCIRIRDDGPGIAPDQLQRVFEPFYRIETSRSREFGGTGLGLTIAANLAEQHGGSIRLANHPEGGLEVVLELPRPMV